MKPVKRIAILQSNYIPWKGYFDLIRAVDLFIIHDDIQFTKQDWRNRNRIKAAEGLRWLTIAVETKAKFGQTIEETRLARQPGRSIWAKSHWAALQQSYRHAPYFGSFGPMVRDMMFSLIDEPMLSEINVALLRGLCRLLQIETPIVFSREFAVTGRKSERVLALCQAAGATNYLSGPAARSYLDVTAFSDAGIDIVFADYSNYPEYPQLHGPFEHAVSVLDLLFHVGPNAISYLKDVARWDERGEEQSPCVT